MIEQTNLLPKRRFKKFKNSGLWEKYKVFECGNQIFGGGTPKTGLEEYWNGNIPWIQSSDLIEDVLVVKEPRKKITEEALKNSATKIIPKNSIAVVTRVGVGKLALMEVEYATSQDFISISNLKLDKWFTTYVLYHLLQKEKEAVQGTSIKGMTKDDLISKKITTPTSNNEQRSIGEYFLKLDNLITLQQRKLEKTKALKAAYLSEMFPAKGEFVPKRRFTKFDDDWKQRKVSEFGNQISSGGTPKTNYENYWNGDIPWIQSSDLTEDIVAIKESRKKITEEAVNNSATKIIPKNSIAVVTRVGVGKLALIPFEYATSQDFLSISNLNLDKWFATYALYNVLQKEKKSVQGTSIKGMTKDDLLTKEIMIPTSHEEQQQIGAYFLKLDNLIALHQHKLNKLQNLKKAYLHEMFV